MRFVRSLTVLMMLLLVGLAVAQPVVHTLDNGMTVLIKESHTAPVVSVRFYVGTGACYEGEWLGSGISHFVEHAIDGGTPTRTGDEIDAIIESIGNASNAATGPDSTFYYISTSSEYWQLALEVLGDYILNPTFPEEVVEQERGVILREMSMGDDEPGRRIWDLFSDTMFISHPSRHRVIGYPERFRALTRDDLVRFHAERYAPENVVLAIAGDVEAAEVIEQCTRLFADVPRRAAIVPLLPDEAPQTAARRRVEVDPALDQAYLMIGVRTVDLLHPDLFALDVASHILSNGAASRLVRTLRDERGLVSSIDTSSYTPPKRPGVFVASAVLDPKNVTQAEEAIWAELLRLRDEKVSKEELERAKTQKAAELVFAGQTAEQQADLIGSDYLSTGNPTFSEAYVEQIRAITAEDIMRVAQTYFVESGRCTALLTPRAPRAARQVKADAAELKVEQLTLDNGLTVLLGESHATPIVSVVTVSMGGVRAESPQNNGVCNLMTDALLRGTTSRTREQIAKALEDRGGGIGTFAGRNSFGVTASALAADLRVAVELVADVLRNPTFPEEELSRLKALALAGLGAEKDNVFATATRLFTGEMYTSHPYGMMPSGTEESVGALTREDVVSFHQEHCRPGATVVAIYGDFDPAVARELVEAAFADWAGETGTLVAPPHEPPLTDTRTVTHAMEQQQSVIYIGFQGPQIADEDFYVREVLDAMLSGKSLPGGPLHNTLRGRQLVYMVHAFSSEGLEPGHFGIIAATAPETVNAALEAIREVVTQFQAAVPDGEALATGKRICIAEDALAKQEIASVAQGAALDTLYGLGYDRGDHYAERVNAVTAEDVHRVANELLDLDRCVTVIVGPAGAN